MDKVAQLESKQEGKNGQKKGRPSRSEARPKLCAEDIKGLFDSLVQLGDCSAESFSGGFRLFLAETEDPEKLKKSLASLGERLKKVQEILSTLMTIS